MAEPARDELPKQPTELELERWRFERDSKQRDLDNTRRTAEVNLEKTKAESTRILEMIKTGDSEKAASNLDFLLKSGLVTDDAIQRKLTAYLASRTPGGLWATLHNAWLGLAAAMRMSDRYDEALHALERAQHLAEPMDHAALAQIHHLRGDLHFPLGRIAECMREHRLGLEHAHRARSEEWETRILGGLADVLFASGCLVSAYDRFEEGIRLAMQHGTRNVEVANLVMQGSSHFY